MSDKRRSYLEKIFDFYYDEKLIKDFKSSLFKEGNPEGMLLPRLQRAVNNEAVGNIWHSRYGIWSAGVSVIINGALEAIQTNNNAKAIELLKKANVAVMAYRDIQAVFDLGEFGFADIISCSIPMLYTCWVSTKANQSFFIRMKLSRY